MPFKKFLIIFLPLLILAVSSAGAYYWFKQALSPVSKDTSAPETTFIVAPNEPAGAVIAGLMTKSLIRSPLAAKIYLRVNQLGGKLRPGGYSLSPAKSASEIFTLLTSGPADIRVTIPEGWRREQIAAKLAAVLTGPLKNFDPAVFIKETATLEGRLFPDTYLLPADISTSVVINMLTVNFSKKTGLVPDSDTAKITLILASLVEREAKTDSDRQLIASILKKRLAADWPLQVDASVQYSMDNRSCEANLLDCNWWRNPVATDYPSAFNTYLHPGLPPGPICNPGLATIVAVENASDSAYWYYMTGTDGVTRYARDLAGHNSNIDKYLR